MLAIVRIALSRPYTFVVLALLILLAGVLAAVRMPVDIFPSINIPIVAVAWQYQGLPPHDMVGRIITPYQRALTTTVNDIEHIEANSYANVGIVKIFFHPTVNIATANAQVTAISQTLLRQLPPGTTPPLILNYSASTVPIIQLALSGAGLTEQILADLGFNFVRPRLVTVEGAGIPWPFGGKSPQVMFDLDTAALEARGLTGLDVANALAAQNLITPVGTEKIGAYEYTVNLNSAPSKISELGDLPIKSVGGAMVYMHDVAQVHNGNAVQTNIVHVDGNRSVLLSVFKNGTTSTLDIVSGIKRMLQVIKPSLPDALQIKTIADQSLFVRASINGVIREGVIAAALTSLMILLFLGSVRSTLIVSTSIPLSILGSIATLSAIGETLNIMTLGGLRSDGDDREHQLPPRAGQGGRKGDHRWVRANRGSGFRLIAVHLHRIHSDVLPAGRCALPVRPASRERDVRHGLLVLALAHPGADDGEVSAAQARRCRRAGVEEPVGTLPAWV
jgi:multidrug efflux pump subunit AcrB